MTIHHLAPTLFILACISALPLKAHADLIQDSADIRSSTDPKYVGGWVQDLGTGLSGTLTGASFPIRLIPVPFGRAPRFQFMLEEFADTSYSDNTKNFGSITWPANYISFDPKLGNDAVDTTLSLAIPEDTIRYPMNPDRAYRMSLELSSFMSNGSFQVYGSQEDTYVHGSTSAPGLGDMAFNLFGVSRPEPAPEPSSEKLVSNVLFLPGIKGSRLYREDTSCTGCERMLWEPYANRAINDLMLSPTGTSLYDDIYVHDEDVIDSVLGTTFYESFFSSLRAAQDEGIYGPTWKWKPIAYDWRLSLNDLLNNGVQEGDRIYYARASSTPYIEQTLRELASSSPTGKVTIVAHSNGGLLAKALMRKLGETQSSELVDDLIFVGVPQIGAPQAIGALLYGYGEALPRSQCADSLVVGWLCGMFVDRSTARAFAENAPMGYHLLPSHTYVRFGASETHPIVKFSGTQLYTAEQTRYGSTLNTVDELYEYLLAADGGRERPASALVDVPNVLSEQLIAYARSIHASIDSWTPSSSMTFHQIAGWGLPTISGIELYEEPRILGLFGTTVPRYRPLFSQDGDGVVPQYSATPRSGGFVRRYWIDLPKENEDHDSAFAHSSLLEHPALADTVHAILTDNPLPDTLLTSAPQLHDTRRWRIFMLHSPLSLELYDKEGNHVGPRDDSFDSNIPNVTYGEFGEVKYLIVPADAAFTLELNGKEHGSFSLEIQDMQGGRVLTTTTLANVPSTPLTIARMEIGEEIASSTLMIDHDGDGSADALMEPVLGSISLYDGSQPSPISPPPKDPDDTPHTEEVPSTSESSRTTPATRQIIEEVPQSPYTPSQHVVGTTASSTASIQDEARNTDSNQLAGVAVAPSSQELPVESLERTNTLSASAATAGESLFARMWKYLLKLLQSLLD